MYVFLWKISTHDIVESNFWVKASLSDHSLIVVVMGISCYWHGADYEREDGPSFEWAWNDQARVPGAAEGDGDILPTLSKAEESSANTRN